jgi:hypothetical protein
VKKLESPHVKIQSLEPWLLRNFDNSTTPEDRRRHLTKIQRQYRGYFCKPAAMLAALDEGYKVVALVDLDTVLVQRSVYGCTCHWRKHNPWFVGHLRREECDKWHTTIRHLRAANRELDLICWLRPVTVRSSSKVPPSSKR